MKFLKVLPWITTAVLSLVLFTQKPEIIKVEIPSKEGSFELPAAPEPIVIKEVDTVEIIKFKELPEPEKVKVYVEATKKRKYKEVFKDSVITITANAETTGTLDSLEISYKTEPEVIPIRQKTRSSLYAGASVRLNKYERPTIEPKLYLMNNETIMSVGYDLKQKNFTVGVAWKLNFRKNKK